MLSQILHTILIAAEVLLIFNLLIVVHELGHFLAGRWRGLVIDEFGIRSAQRCVIDQLHVDVFQAIHDAFFQAVFLKESLSHATIANRSVAFDVFQDDTMLCEHGHGRIIGVQDHTIFYRLDHIGLKQAVRCELDVKLVTCDRIGNP